MHFETPEGVVRAVDGVSFAVHAGRVFGLVGESGCGKSVTALSIMGILPTPPGRIVSGHVRFKGVDLLGLPEPQLRRIRGREIAMIFQEPMTSLNPVFTIGNQIMEAMRVHLPLSKAEARERAVALLEQVGIPDPEQRMDEYPHQLSGGMRQRVMIAMAISCNPSLLIADEPTTALDVTIQAQILDLLEQIRRDTGAAMILITHDLGIIAEVADEVAIMYAGEIVEWTDTLTLFREPRHPYTRGLLDSLPRMDARGGRLKAIPGTVPQITRPPKACRFAPRCAYAVALCLEAPPPLEEVAPGHTVRCVRAREPLF